jgi:hypothetical protein
VSKFAAFTDFLKAISAATVAGSIVYAVVFLGSSIIFHAPGGIDLSIGYADFPNARFVPEALRQIYQVQFWTPSSKSKEAPSAHEWEKIADDSKIEAFADELMKRTISGYRRYEVTGAGLGGEKIGMWWIVTLRSGVTPEQFLQVYNESWKPGDDRTYMEIRSIRGGYDPTHRP